MANRQKGYHRHFRGRFLLIKNGVLTDSEFVLWDYSFSNLADWDKEHEAYGCFEFSLTEIAESLNWSKSKVSRIANKLRGLGFWQTLENGTTQVAGYEIHSNYGELAKKFKIIDLQRYLSNLQFDIAVTEHFLSNQQPKGSKRIKQSSRVVVANTETHQSKEALGSYKGDIGFLRSDKEYMRIWKEMGSPPNFTIDDMKWIDLNVKEDAKQSN